MVGIHCHSSHLSHLGLSLSLHTGSSKEEKILKGLAYLGGHVGKIPGLRDRNIRNRQQGRELDQLYINPHNPKRQPSPYNLLIGRNFTWASVSCCFSDRSYSAEGEIQTGVYFKVEYFKTPKEKTFKRVTIFLSSPRYTYIRSQHSPHKLLCIAILVFTDPYQPTVLKTLATIIPQITNLLNQSSFSMSPDCPRI